MKFTQSHPILDRIRNIKNKEWGLKSNANIGILNARHILVTTQSEDDCNKAMTRDQFRTDDAMFRIFHWTLNYDTQKESLIVQRRIWLLGLPSNYLASCLNGIDISISKCYSVDEKSSNRSNPAYGRICIEVDLSKILSNKVWIGTLVNTAFRQPIIIEGRT